MKTGIFTVYDKVAEIHSLPMNFKNAGVAKRIIGNCVKNPEHNYGMNPEDFELHHVGNFNEETGEIEIPTDETKILELTELKVEEK